MDEGLLYLGDDKFPTDFDVEFRSEAILRLIILIPRHKLLSGFYLSAYAGLFSDQLATPAFILRTDDREICIKDYKYPKPDLSQAIALHFLLTHAGELRKRVSLRNPFSGDKTLYIYAIDKKAIFDKIGGGKMLVEFAQNCP